MAAARPENGGRATHWVRKENGEHCAHLMEEDIPPLQEGSDSNEDSECGSDYADEFGSEYSYSSHESFVTADSEAESFVTANEEPEPPVKRTIWDLPAQDRGMFELVDDLPDEEFVPPRKTRLSCSLQDEKLIPPLKRWNCDVSQNAQYT
ncbi:hypothetical protein C8R44DRAFT_746286 [Mycena epipterygia]|nr:hypothetical protein C8R44DRAFT_746286 [Mycena epipterygia]